LNVGRKFERLSGPFRRGRETQEFARLVPEIFSTPPGDVFQPAGRPIRDRSENCRPFGDPIRFPKVGHNWLSRRVPFKSVPWDRELFRADIFAKREERVMTAEIVDRRFYALVDLDLLNPRIALDINNAIALQQIVIELLRPANVQDRVGVPIKLANFF